MQINFRPALTNYSQSNSKANQNRTFLQSKDTVNFGLTSKVLMENKSELLKAAELVAEIVRKKSLTTLKVDEFYLDKEITFTPEVLRECKSLEDMIKKIIDIWEKPLNYLGTVKMVLSIGDAQAGIKALELDLPKAIVSGRKTTCNWIEKLADYSDAIKTYPNQEFCNNLINISKKLEDAGYASIIGTTKYPNKTDMMMKVAMFKRIKENNLTEDEAVMGCAVHALNQGELFRSEDIKSIKKTYNTLLEYKDELQIVYDKDKKMDIVTLTPSRYI